MNIQQKVNKNPPEYSGGSQQLKTNFTNYNIYQSGFLPSKKALRLEIFDPFLSSLLTVYLL